jgi:peptide/nickel transport system substrate-binding protein
MVQKARARALCVVMALALLAAACGDDGGGGTAEEPDGSTTAPTETTTAAEPQRGGIITIGQYSTPPGLDPALLAGGGTVGGNEAAALYDTLIRYNLETQEYEGRTAESMEPNADFTEWTMKIRPGITFTDGTPYDAAAVKFVLDRQMTSGNASPKGQMLSFISPETVTVVDDLTLHFKLKKAWTDFPYIFTGVAGLIYSPTAFAAAGSPENFALNPGNAGAGPFKLKSYRVNEAIEFERNPDYWGGEVPLDGLKFILLQGAALSYEGLQAGTLDAMFVRDPEIIQDAKDAGYGSLDMPAIGGNLGIMNSGIVITCAGGKPEPVCSGKADGEKIPSDAATANKNVRLAVSHAIDPEVINERVYNGAALPNSAPFANSPWDPGVEGVPYDLDEAKRLVEVAKGEGWDGKIRVLAGNDPVSTTWGQTVATLLEAANMEVELDTAKPISGVVQQVLVQRDFDIATWGLGWLDESPVNYLQLVGSFLSTSPRYGYSSPDMDAAMDMLRVAETQEERVEAYRAVSEVWVRDVPGHVIATIMQAMLHRAEIHGLQRTGQSITLFHEAWLEQ